MVKSKISKGKVALIAGAIGSVVLPAAVSAQDNQERPPAIMDNFIYASHRNVPAIDGRCYAGKIFDYNLWSNLRTSQSDKNGVNFEPIWFYDIDNDGQFGKAEIDAIRAGIPIFMNQAFNDTAKAEVAGEYSSLKGQLAQEKAKSNANLQTLADYEQEISRLERQLLKFQTPFVSPLNTEKAPTQSPTITDISEYLTAPKQEQKMLSPEVPVNQEKPFPFGISSLFPEGLSQFQGDIIPPTQETSETSKQSQPEADFFLPKRPIIAPETPESFLPPRAESQGLPGYDEATIKAFQAIKEGKMDKKAYWSLITQANAGMSGNSLDTFGGSFGPRINFTKDFGLAALVDFSFALNKITDSSSNLPLSAGRTFSGNTQDMYRFLIGAALEAQLGPFIVGGEFDYRSWITQIFSQESDSSGKVLKSSTLIDPLSPYGEFAGKVYGGFEAPLGNDNNKLGAVIGKNFSNDPSNYKNGPYFGLRYVRKLNQPKKE